MISHLIAVFIGAAFVGVPVGICVMAMIYAGKQGDEGMYIKPGDTVIIRIPKKPEPEGYDWSKIGV